MTSPLDKLPACSISVGVETVAGAEAGGESSMDAASDVTAEEHTNKALSVGRGEVGGPSLDGEEALWSGIDASSAGVGVDAGYVPY